MSRYFNRVFYRADIPAPRFVSNEDACPKRLVVAVAFRARSLGKLAPRPAGCGIRSKPDTEPGVAGKAVAVQASHDCPVGQHRDEGCPHPHRHKSPPPCRRWLPQPDESSRDRRAVRGQEDHDADQGAHVDDPLCHQPLVLEPDERSLEVADDHDGQEQQYGAPGPVLAGFPEQRPKGGMVQKRPFSGNTRALSADPDRSRVGAGLRESLVAVLGLQFRENRVYPCRC